MEQWPPVCDRVARDNTVMDHRQHEFDGRTTLAMALVIVSCWTVARLVSREEYGRLPLLFGPVTGAIVGGLYGKIKGAWPGIGIGLGVAMLLIFLDLLLWLLFTLPPHPRIDF
jgi:hypothetical protein